MKFLSMLAGMYAITFTLFMVETGCLWKALSMGFVSALLKSAYSLIHGNLWSVHANSVEG